MIFNKELGISEDDISVEDDLQTLAYWRDALNAQLTSILNRFDVDCSHQLPTSAKRAYRYIHTLERMAHKRYGTLRNDIAVANGYVYPSEMRKARHLASKFMEVSKRELPDYEYLRILQISKEELKAAREKNHN